MAWQTVFAEGQISSAGALTLTSGPYNGLLLDVRINVLQSNHSTASSNTVSIVIAETGMITSTLLTKTGVTGANNRYAPQIETMTNAGVATGLYRPYSVSGKLTVTCSSGTQNDWVQVAITIAE